MARRFWKDRVVEKPRTYNIQNNPDGTVTLIPAPGAILEAGTPVNAANLNGLEEDLETHKAEKASQNETHGIRVSHITNLFEFYNGEEWRAIPNDVPNDIFDISGSPGSKMLIAGSMTAGFFGIVKADELWTGTQLSSAVGISQGTIINNDIDWLKFALDGKILFTPIKPIRHSLSWNTINNVGCVFGTKTISKNGLTYKVRLIKGALTDPAAFGNPDKGAKGSEWNRLILPIHEQAIDSSWVKPEYVEDNIPVWKHSYGTGKQGMFKDADLGLGSSTSTGNFHLCQEVVSNNPSNRVGRGQADVSDTNYRPTTETYGNIGWVPVLELVV